MLDRFNVVIFVFKVPPECSLFTSSTSSPPTLHSTLRLSLDFPLRSFNTILLQVLSQGRNLLASPLSPDHSKDVRLQMKVLNER